MSKIFENENQLILRVPIEIARKINESIEKGKGEPDSIELVPLLEKDETEPMKFKFKFANNVSRATLIELPTIIESQKTLDHVNYFKSNDICQMIYVHPNNEDNFDRIAKSRKIARKLLTKLIKKDIYGKIDQYKGNRYLARDGITKPTKCIRTRFYRKQMYITESEANEVENAFTVINGELTKTKKDNNKEGETKKRRYKRNKFYN